MNPDLVAFLVALAGVALYIFVCIPVARWAVGRLTGRSFHFRLRPEQNGPQGQWSDIAWSAATLVATMAMVLGAMEVLGLGP